MSAKVNLRINIQSSRYDSWVAQGKLVDNYIGRVGKDEALRAGRETREAIKMALQENTGDFADKTFEEFGFNSKGTVDATLKSIQSGNRQVVCLVTIPKAGINFIAKRSTLPSTWAQRGNSHLGRMGTWWRGLDD